MSRRRDKPPVNAHLALVCMGVLVIFVSTLVCGEFPIPLAGWLK